MNGPGWSAWPAPAKLNLFLHVTGRRPDGYHALQTVFRLLDWGDTLRLRVRDDGRIVRLRATARGEGLLAEGRSRRVRRLAAPLGELSASERETLRRASEILSRVVARLRQS